MHMQVHAHIPKLYVQGRHTEADDTLGSTISPEIQTIRLHMHLYREHGYVAHSKHMQPLSEPRMLTAAAESHRRPCALQAVGQKAVNRCGHMKRSAVQLQDCRCGTVADSDSKICERITVERIEHICVHVRQSTYQHQSRNYLEQRQNPTVMLAYSKWQEHWQPAASTPSSRYLTVLHQSRPARVQPAQKDHLNVWRRQHAVHTWASLRLTVSVLLHQSRPAQTQPARKETSECMRKAACRAYLGDVAPGKSYAVLNSKPSRCGSAIFESKARKDLDRIEHKVTSFCCIINSLY